MTRALLFILTLTFFYSPFVMSPQAQANILDDLKQLGVRFDMPAEYSSEPLEFERAGTQVNIDASQSVLVYRSPLQSILQTVKESDGTVRLDCSLFVQIAALFMHFQTNDTNAKKDFFVFPVGKLDSFVASATFRQDFGYVHLLNEEAHQTLQATSFNNKGQWVLRVGPDSFLGLARGGPIITSKSEWIRLTKEGLAREIQSAIVNKPTTHHSKLCVLALKAHDRNQSLYSSARIMQILEAQGKSAQWELSVVEAEK